MSARSSRRAGEAGTRHGSKRLKDPASLLIGALVALGFVVGRLYSTSSTLQQWAPPCVFRSLFDVPCPTCGTTRVFVLLANFDVVGALWLAPLPSLLIAVGALLGVWSLARQFGWVQKSADDFVGDNLENSWVMGVLLATVVFLWVLSLMRTHSL